MIQNDFFFGYIDPVSSDRIFHGCHLNRWMCQLTQRDPQFSQRTKKKQWQLLVRSLAFVFLVVGSFLWLLNITWYRTEIDTLNDFFLDVFSQVGIDLNLLLCFFLFSVRRFCCFGLCCIHLINVYAFGMIWTRFLFKLDICEKNWEKMYV